MKRSTIIAVVFLLFGYTLSAQTYKTIYGTDLILTNEAGINTISLTPPAISSSVTLTLPSATGSGSQVLASDGAGGLKWITPTAGGISGNDQEIFYRSGTGFATSQDFVFNYTDNHLGIGIQAPTAAVHTAGSVRVGDGVGRSGIKLYNDQAGTDRTLTITAPDGMTSNSTFRLPSDYGSANQLITTNGSGSFQWSTAQVSTGGNDCIGIGNDGNDQGNNTVNSALGYIGGGTGNVIQEGGSNSFIGGGEDNTVSGTSSAGGAGENNQVLGDFSFIAGGRFNIIRDDYSSILGGESNEILTGATYSFIGAGDTNTIASTYSNIGAGRHNSIGVNSTRSTIGGGGLNHIINSPSSSIMAGIRDTITGGSYNHIGAGDNNKISSANLSVIYAGERNEIQAGNSNAIGSGEDNIITDGEYSVIVGGEDNTLNGDYSIIIGNESTVNADYAIAMGRNSNAVHNGSFVMKSGTNVSLSSTRENEFSALFEGGGEFMTNAGGNNGVQLTTNGTGWVSTSDSTKKSQIRLLDNQQSYFGLKNLDIYSWAYTSDESGQIRNYGPMAQDFFAIFGNDGIGQIGTDTTLVPNDLTAVSLSALQYAYILQKQKSAQLDEIKSKNDQLENEIRLMEELLDRMEGKIE
jgi:hypothetical protein